MKRTHLLGLSVALASLAAAFALWRLPSRSIRPVPGVSYALRWPAGTRYLYDVEWRGEQQARLFGSGQGGGGTVSGSADVAGRLELESLGERGGATVLAARIGSLARTSLQVMDQQAIPDADALFGGRAAYVELEPSGAIRAFQFRPEDPPQFKSVMQFLLTQAQVALPSARGLRGEARWEREEAGPFGTSRVAYEVRSAVPLALHRARLSYSKLDAVPGGVQAGVAVELAGEADAELAPEGHLRALRLEERVRVPGDGAAAVMEAQVTVRWTLRGVERGEAAKAPAVLEGLETRAPGQVVVSAEARRRALEGRADGLTREALIDALSHAGTGELPDGLRFMWRATGLLRLHPEYCEDLKDPFEGGTAPGKALILDLVASTGHAQAQAVMRELLGSTAVRASPDFPMLVQRASVLDRPTVETADFVADVYRRARGPGSDDVRHAGAMTLGALIRALPRDGDATGVADELHDVLREDLKEAKGDERQFLLRALGNAGRADDVPVALEAARAASEDVRYASALALRHTDTPEATSALVSLLSDRNTAVQSAALVALAEHTLPAPQLEAIRAAVANGSVNAVNAAQLAGLLSQAADRQAARAALEALAAREDVDARLRAQIRLVLAGGAG